MAGSEQPRKKIVILGSTGSIGENVVRVVERFPERFQIIGLAALRQTDRLLQQAARFGAGIIAVGEKEAAKKCVQQAPAGVRVLAGEGGLEELAALGEADIVVAAIVGMAGLKPVLAALRQGKCVALATKEALVVAGEHVMKAREKNGASLLPVDSEHSAIFQCLHGHSLRQVRRLILTASGGPFANHPEIDFDKVTISEVLKHPRWHMGRKVTVDSATMMNKGLEMMEARWLFNVELERIGMLIHPESIVHSLVEFIDGAILAQLSVSDMRFAIQYALSYPERLDGRLPELDLAKLNKLHFAAPDEARFPCLALARHAAQAGGTMPAVLNAANEIAVGDFLRGNIRFADIWRVVEQVMNRHAGRNDASLEEIMLADQRAREEARQIINKRHSKG